MGEAVYPEETIVIIWSGPFCSFGCQIFEDSYLFEWQLNQHMYGCEQEDERLYCATFRSALQQKRSNCIQSEFTKHILFFFNRINKIYTRKKLSFYCLLAQQLEHFPWMQKHLINFFLHPEVISACYRQRVIWTLTSIFPFQISV